MGDEFEARKDELIAAGLWTGNKTLLRFCFGNTHEDVQNPKQSRSKPGTKNTHRWCMFMSLNDNVDETSKYIKSVTYYLHPTFKPSVIKISEAPFLLSRLGWGYFPIQMVVEYQPEVGIKPMTMEHMLCFDGKGKTQSVLIEAEDGNDKKMGEELAKELAKI